MDKMKIGRYRNKLGKYWRGRVVDKFMSSAKIWLLMMMPATPGESEEGGSPISPLHESDN